MSRLFRLASVLLIVFIVLFVLAGLGVVGVYAVSGTRLNKSYDIQPSAVPLPTDEGSLAYGKDTADFYCAGCHGVDFSGQVISASPLDGVAAPPNLTAGQGGTGEVYADEDWVRAIRHGLAPDGSPLPGMPSDRFDDLDNAALGALIAYLKSVPPVDNDLPNNSIGLVPRLNLLAGRDPLLAAERIDHEALLGPPGDYYLVPVEEETGEE